MRIDLDRLYQTVEPWSLVIAIDGKDRAVRRLSNADMAALCRAGGMTPAEGEAFIAGLFEEADRPDVSSWDQVKAGMTIAAIVAYYEEAVFRKKCQSTKEVTRAAIEGRAPGEAEPAGARIAPASSNGER